MGRTRRILPVGDSITAGYTDNPAWTVPFGYGYRRPLWDLLQAYRPGGYTYVGAGAEPWNRLYGDPAVNPATSRYLTDLGQDHHRGYGGQGAAFVSAHIAEWMVADQPDIVLLLIGINDIPAGSAADPITVKTNVQAIVQKVFTAKPDAQVLVAKIFEQAGSTPAILTLNAWTDQMLVPLFAGQGRTIVAVDQRAALLNGALAATPDLYSNGSNHPTEAGYARMAEAWATAITALP